MPYPVYKPYSRLVFVVQQVQLCQRSTLRYCILLVVPPVMHTVSPANVLHFGTADSPKRAAMHSVHCGLFLVTVLTCLPHTYLGNAAATFGSTAANVARHLLLSALVSTAAASMARLGLCRWAP